MILYHGKSLAGNSGGTSEMESLTVDELNYEQYSALSDEQKASGAYFVPDWPGDDVPGGCVTMDDVNAAIDAAITGAMEEAY